MDKQTLTTLFESAVAAKASDIHVAVGSPLLFRIDGNLIPQTKQEMTAEQALGVVKAVLSEHQFKRFSEEKEIDVSFSLKSGTRLRVNCSFERGYVALAARIIPFAIPTLEELMLTEIAQRIYRFDDGLILFTGPTGMGKSTSLASILQTINAAESHHIITLEDPIEFLFPKGKCLVRQREYGQDFLTFPEALKRVLRQDPNIILVGEMRDPDTISAALTLAETGHLIFGTLHTPNTMQTIDRIIDAFSPHQQSQIRAQLSLSLKMVIAQKLLPRVGGGRVALREVLINTPAVSNTIRDQRTQELTTVIQTAENIGMVTFAKSAEKLLKEGLISKETYDFQVPAAK
ncbi:MAG: PilT/PilU family type 4a pilus ATPase [Patescibacteria group bacterium]